MAHEQVVGAWRLVACTARSQDGDVIYPYGQQPRGRLMYDVTGQMSVHLMRADRPAFASSVRSESTPDETKGAFDGFDAYFGTYELREAEGVVIHHVEGSLFPNWTGTDQTRFFTIAGDQLILSTPPIRYQGTMITLELVWARVSGN